MGQFRTFHAKKISQALDLQLKEMNHVWSIPIKKWPNSAIFYGFTFVSHIISCLQGLILIKAQSYTDRKFHDVICAMQKVYHIKCI